ncbi:MAG: alkaline phosphatase D family protein [Gemmatimonadota bacterium]
MTINRREFLAVAAALGAGAAWGYRAPRPSRAVWRERRDLYPEGVASGDPGPDGVILWTRRPGTNQPIPLTVEVAEDEAFSRVVASARTVARSEHDWTVRVLVGRLAPAREYWYRFSDENGDGSRVGRTVTAPADGDPRPVRFAFVSCQDPTTGSLHAWRRMIYEDQRAAPDERLSFVLHLGDFVYEVVNYPEDRPNGYYDRTVREIFRYPRGEKIRDFHVPVDVDDYRALYRAYLHDPDLQDARARFPFVAMWDNHEFSWHGWQSLRDYGTGTTPAQTMKVAANQAWWEFQPARVVTPARSLERFEAPRVSNAAIARFDDSGLGVEPNNRAALASLTGYRALRFGRHLELIITDQHSYRSEEPTTRSEARAFSTPDFPGLFAEEAMAILDAGRTANGGRPPATIRWGDRDVPNFRRDAPPQTILGAEQKAWFLKRLRSSRATWKVWGNSQGVLDGRADPQNIPGGVTAGWPGAGYAAWGGGGDYGTAYTERGEIYDVIARERISGFACVSGDRHSFWAGTMAKTLPPLPFDPVGVTFITGSISAAGVVEANEHRFPKEHPLRPLFLVDRPTGRPEPTINMLLRHGVRACLEYARSGDLARARGLTNPENAPHLSFVDMGGHGYATVRVGGDALACEFVCIPRPTTPIPGADGGPVRYRLLHRAALWKPGERPVLEQRVLDGEAGLGA